MKSNRNKIGLFPFGSEPLNPRGSPGSRALPVKMQSGSKRNFPKTLPHQPINRILPRFPQLTIHHATRFVPFVLFVVSIIPRGHRPRLQGKHLIR